MVYVDEYNGPVNDPMDGGVRPEERAVYPSRALAAEAAYRTALTHTGWGWTAVRTRTVLEEERGAYTVIATTFLGRFRFTVRVPRVVAVE